MNEKHFSKKLEKKSGGGGGTFKSSLLMKKNMRKRKNHSAHKLALESCATDENSSAKSLMRIRTKKNKLHEAFIGIVWLIFRSLALKCLLSLALLN